MKISKDYVLLPITAEEIITYLEKEGVRIDAFFSTKLEFLGLLYHGAKNECDCVSFMVPDQVLKILSELLDGSFDGSSESRIDAWNFFWGLAYAKSPEYCEECYGTLKRNALQEFQKEFRSIYSRT
jgi:hypothetical protein